tara:strand:- start:71 stop:256 length:186 start_codon:yes stop_codon:yes gene_type:complete
MSRIDVTDKDPFSNAISEEIPKDDVSGFGFLFRAVIRYARIYVLWTVIGYCIYYVATNYII